VLNVEILEVIVAVCWDYYFYVAEHEECSIWMALRWHSRPVELHEFNFSAFLLQVADVEIDQFHWIYFLQ